MLLHILYLIGISVEASSGALSAGRKHMDFFGVIMIAAITALGGGTVRDVLIGNYPLSWVGHPEYLIFTTAAAVITIYLVRFISRLSIVFLILDAIGLVTFAIIGTEKGLALSLPFSVCAIMGMCTGIFWGSDA
ncbi:trimeric intracellular cation channel family protein [Piscirickettsia litoralis]|uniref:trimeric intracellular cation channel family protein n=1 Tax=Piscirickettsia litoralis TaxID=1891921 RepID=UPI0022859620|nr:TRIC cation channel family protein [Piscirickettsia litoralis]